MNIRKIIIFGFLRDPIMAIFFYDRLPEYINLEPKKPITDGTTGEQ